MRPIAAVIRFSEIYGEPHKGEKNTAKNIPRNIRLKKSKPKFLFPSNGQGSFILS